jgi:hypothetical protein
MMPFAGNGKKNDSASKSSHDFDLLTQRIDRLESLVGEQERRMAVYEKKLQTAADICDMLMGWTVSGNIRNMDAMKLSEMIKYLKGAFNG